MPDLDPLSFTLGFLACLLIAAGALLAPWALDRWRSREDVMLQEWSSGRRRVGGGP